VKVAIDMNGLFYVESAQLIEEVEEMEVDTNQKTADKDATTPVTPSTATKDNTPKDNTTQIPSEQPKTENNVEQQKQDQPQKNGYTR